MHYWANKKMKYKTYDYCHVVNSVKFLWFVVFDRGQIDSLHIRTRRFRSICSTFKLLLILELSNFHRLMDHVFSVVCYFLSYYHLSSFRTLSDEVKRAFTRSCLLYGGFVLGFFMNGLICGFY